MNWTSIKNGLPKRDDLDVLGMVLIFGLAGGVMMQDTSVYLENGEDIQERFVDSEHIWRVTHWMPLPDRPQGFTT